MYNHVHDYLVFTTFWKVKKIRKRVLCPNYGGKWSEKVDKKYYQKKEQRERKITVPFYCVTDGRW